ncbi:hypothetical protein PIB30_051315 [Stylosanthes scabra]|uniref:Ubiquitin-like protease family profile domain-containing protein n=1 Tax=Stylosanthes scabra TaxID=79078 RepID=A0ABU6RID8_9FABA|nr:hypothetical protein [Stylosanthes scabra]
MFLPHTTQENSTKLSKALGIKSDCGKKLKARKNIKIHSPASDDIPSEELTKIGIYIPSWLPISFRPPPWMILKDIETIVATYVYYAANDDKVHSLRTLAKSNHFSANISSFKTLCPEICVDQNVLNVFVSMLTHHERSLSDLNMNWFIPTTFSQYILDEEVSSKNMRQKYQEDFMEKVDYLRKMFVSVKEDNNHWYLVVFDFRKQKVILLDSKPDPSKEDSKELTIKRLALYIEVMLQDATFYDSKRTVVPKVSKFHVVVPDEMSVERCESFFSSNDGGIWVAQWMNECGWCDKYFSIDIDIDTRMRLALDLILHPYNLKRNVVIKSAQQNYPKIEKKCMALARK